jgi:predicted NAD/FAD-binding protein
MKIAIIGAGVSGLTTAYYLRQQSKLDNDTITVFDTAEKVGGNAKTMWVRLPNGSERWVDMGVNDFNLQTYKELAKLWVELKLMTPTVPCPSSEYCKPLQNTESFCSQDEGFKYRYYIKDGHVTAPGDSSAPGPHLESQIGLFKDALYDWYKQHQDEGVDSVTVGEWLNAQKVKFSDPFIYTNLFPRINGMYYTMEEGETPGNLIPPYDMPLWMVAHYYVLQEAYGQTIPVSLQCPRQYFVNGSYTWLEKLEEKVKALKVEVTKGVRPFKVFRRPDGQFDLHNEVLIDTFDKVIFATHPDDTYTMIENFKEEPMAKALREFSMSKSTVVVHTDPRFLPPQQDCNMTYNIHIYNYVPGRTYYPYTITYIENYHQNDQKTPADPLFFTSVNPQFPIDSKRVLKQLDGITPAEAEFYHCKLNRKSVAAQVFIEKTQMGEKVERGYYFAGSFTKGAGLHEECIIHSQELAKKIANPLYESDQSYHFNSPGKQFAPRYIREAFDRTKKK